LCQRVDDDREGSVEVPLSVLDHPSYFGAPMTSGPDLPPLSRDAFVANVLWIGVNFACQGALGRELDFRGNHRRGEVSCNDGQGDNLHVLWDEGGVVALVHEHELPRHVPFDPPPPPPLQGLAELGGRKLSGLIKATGCLWICGDRSSPRLEPSLPSSLLGILDAFCGPLLISSDEDDALERALWMIARTRGETVKPAFA
jgi:hypothetical protein